MIADRVKADVKELLSSTGLDNYRELLQEMEDKGYFTARCEGHDHWLGGLAEHSLRVTRYMLYMCDHPEEFSFFSIADPQQLKGLCRESVILCGLLHDFGKAGHRGRQEREGHNVRSADRCKPYLRNHWHEWDKVCAAMFFHHNTHGAYDDAYQPYKYAPLTSLLRKADNMASGTAWNAYRFLAGKTQHSGQHSSMRYLTGVALDRTKQILGYHMYLDTDMQFHHCRAYNRALVALNAAPAEVEKALAEAPVVNRGTDVITALRQKYLQEGGKPLLIADTGKWDAPRLMADDLLICSYLLNSFFCSQGTQIGHHYHFSISDSGKAVLSQLSSDQDYLFLPDVTFIRDGASAGYRLVAPWKADVVLIRKAATKATQD